MIRVISTTNYVLRQEGQGPQVILVSHKGQALSRLLVSTDIKTKTNCHRTVMIIQKVEVDML